MSARGFSLVELLLACALLVMVSGAVAALVMPVRAVLERNENMAQLEPAGRSALEAMVADIREAGSDASVVDPRSAVATVLPRVALLRDVDSEEVVQQAAAIRITRTPHLGAQGRLRAAVAAGDRVVSLETDSRCAGGAPSCSFRAGTTAVLHHEGVSQVVSVDDSGAEFVSLRSPLASPFPAGAALSEVLWTTYGARGEADGPNELVRLTSGGAEQPLLDNLVAFVVWSDHPNPLRMTRVTIRVRIEAPATLRGPAGYLFQRSGTASNLRRWLPDVELRFAIALRNSTGAL